MTQLKQYIDAIPPLIPTGSLAELNAIDLGTNAVTGTLPLSHLPDAGVAAGTYTIATVTVNSKGIVTGIASGSAPGGVTSVTVTPANGVSGTVANASTTPAISLTLGAITPSSVAATGQVTGSNLSGTNTGDQLVFDGGTA